MQGHGRVRPLTEDELDAEVEAVMADNERPPPGWRDGVPARPWSEVYRECDAAFGRSMALRLVSIEQRFLH
jgi:hypothetical protein